MGYCVILCLTSGTVTESLRLFRSNITTLKLLIHSSKFPVVSNVATSTQGSITCAE